MGCSGPSHRRVSCKIPGKTKQPVAAKSVIPVLCNEIAACSSPEANILVQDIEYREPDFTGITLPKLLRKPGVPLYHIVIVIEYIGFLPDTNVCTRIEL